MKRIYLIITLLTVCFSCDKKEVTLYGDVTGRILNSRNSEPLQGALVSLTPTNMSTATGADGTYNFTKLEPQQYSILVTKDGFQSNTTNVTVEPGENRFSDILLTPIDPILFVSTSTINFGSNETQIAIEVKNNGGGTLVWAVTENIDWLTANPTNGETTNETNVLIVTVNRSGLTPNTYSQNFIITSNGGSATILATMTVAEGNQAPNAQFSVTPENGTTATNFYFDASASTDDVTSNEDIYVRWQWETGGDFTTWTKTKTETHRYTAEGQKVVTLEARDAQGAVGTASKTINVSYEEPYITVSNPNSTTSWVVGSLQTITWNHNVSDNFKIELFLNGELNRVIANSVSGGSGKEQANSGKTTGNYSWQIPTDLNTSSNYKVKVSSVGNENLFGESPSFIISAFFISVTAPAEGAIWVKESEYSIIWEDNISENVKIDLFKGGALLTTIVASVASNGSFSWVVPAGITQATDYQIKISSTTNTTLFTLSHFFTIVDKPYINITSPNSNSYWAAATTQTIEWQTNIVDPVKIDLYKNNIFVLNITQSTTGTNSKGAKSFSYSWDIPSNLTTANNYQVKITSTADAGVSGISPNFVISEVPYILISKPNSSSSWLPGTSQTITWTDNISENVNIALFKGETLVLNITSSTPSNGSYSWTIPLSLTAADNYKVKITSNTNSELYGVSEPFKIKGYITVSKPDESTLWAIDIEQIVEWQDNIEENVLIELYKGTTLFHTVAESTPSSGTYNFTPTESFANGNDYKIKISSITDPDAVGFSQYFEIKLVTLPTVITNSVSEITSTTATCGGNVTNDGGATVTSRGTCWGTSQNPTVTINQGITSNGIGTGSFTSNLFELIPNTTYYVRAYATNSLGTSYGTQVSFTTYSLPADVTNPTTGQTWLDRNLGASRVAVNSYDAEAYGDLYQWGRLSDGHEKRSSSTTSTLSSSDIPGHSNFIIIGSEQNDWRSPQNHNLWQGVSGINNPCPAGYRLPTEAEWNAERLSWSSNNSTGAFTSLLKLPVAGYRHYNIGSIYYDIGNYWSSTIDGTTSRRLQFGESASLGNGSRALGFSVRCLKD